MATIFDPISSSGAVRNLFVGLTGSLEDDEIINEFVVTSKEPTLLIITNEAINTVPHEGLDKNNKVIVTATGKGIGFTITIPNKTEENIQVLVDITGSNGTKEKWAFIIPVQDYLTC